MGRLTMGAGGCSARRRGPGAWAQLSRGNLWLRLWLGWGSALVREVFRAAFSSEAGAATPGEFCHCLVAHPVSGSEHCVVPRPGAGKGRALYLWAEAPAPGR